jgi:hypothetical protein
MKLGFKEDMAAPCASLRFQTKVELHRPRHGAPRMKTRLQEEMAVPLGQIKVCLPYTIVIELS